MNKSIMKVMRYRWSIQLIFIALTAATMVMDSPVMKAVILLAILLSGAVYCGWACPFGALQDFIRWLGTKAGIRKQRVPNSIHRVAVYGRYILFVALMIPALDVLLQIFSYEPRGGFIGLLAGRGAMSGAIIAILFFMAMSLIYERFYCRYLCIDGARYGMLSLLRIGTIRRRPKTCISCGKCDRACPMQINVSKVETLRSPQCISCGKCLAACPVEETLCFVSTFPVKKNA